MEFPTRCSLSETRSTDACALYTIQSVYTLQICTTSKPFAYASHQLLIQLSLVPSAIMLMTLRNVTWTHRGRFLKYLNHLSRQNGTLATAQTSGPIRYVHLLFSGRLLPRFFLPPSLPHLLYLLTCLYTFMHIFSFWHVYGSIKTQVPKYMYIWCLFCKAQHTMCTMPHISIEDNETH